MRFTLIQVAPGRFEFIWSSHHLLLDGWGMSLVLQELIERYEAGCAGTFFKAVPSRPYRDYIAWIRRQDLARAKEYWEDRLKGFQLAVPLPGESPTQSASPDKKYSEKQRMLPADATAHLQAMARQQQITLSVLTQAAWALLLRYYTGHRDVLFGVTITGRPADPGDGVRNAGPVEQHLTALRVL